MNKNINLANFITILRLVSIPVMVVIIIFKKQDIFAWLLLGALLSDILDGFIARQFKLETQLGSFLDALADTLMYLCAVTGIFIFHTNFIIDQAIPLGFILFFYFAEKIKTFIAYRRFFNSYHNYLAKITAYFQGAFVLSLFFFGYQWFLFYPAAIIGIVSCIEDMILSSILKNYEHDTKGLYWVLKNKDKYERRH
ncbi:MAG: CDP-alcohol phosphatidyltransferase family protein [Spirochaetales bacterium]|nr:CDP-alcohol phosphatidyltransferase family protein [Spirochaetales bacterium]